ncbi:helix-turn-helix domain-containing protein [Nocardia sp. CDC159]|uniref:Helix-turn-helix domain-containing protein n=1 Tax=Nocardia pulmonis TaxID=2951408 RepID=A0A9X2E4M7_9NOCA|nr:MULTISPECIES: helix-turn-helix domain-containing protein [Nocardia]MCM6772755.1 helix-turn-helix domain-containing protein [Nocardia pulmonis]MCM6785942.1 helix-turn-helix domain-containing protein [Nocardia sp. CDC159]
MSGNDWLTREELAARLKVPVKTLAAWAARRPRKGPRYAMVGRYARYRLVDVIAWENEQFGDQADAA